MVYHCKYCNKDIKHKSSWSRHQKTNRHLKKVTLYVEPEENKEEIIETTNESDKIKRLEDIIMKQTEMINRLINKDTTTTTNNNTNNTTNTQNITNNNVININIVGGEDFKGIMDDELSSKFIDYADIKELVLDTYLKKVYIDKEENRNIEYNDPTRKNCKVYKGNGEWERDNINNIIERRIRASKQILPKMFKEMDDYKECEEAYTKVCRNVKDFVNNEKDTKEYNNVVKNHKKDLSNIDTYKYCKCCSKKYKMSNWNNHINSKSHKLRI